MAPFKASPLNPSLGLLLGWLLSVVNALAGPPPVITTQPASQTVQVGGEAIFVVQATSGTTLTYQWYFQSVAIPGATHNSYTRANAQLAHSGNYYVGVTNADGGIYSAHALLTVVTLTVTTTNDSGFGSLREAILTANALPGTNTISFNIPGTGVQTIAPTSPLPVITDPVMIDGYTQPGASPNTRALGTDATLLVELNGLHAGAGVNGLTIEAGGSTVRGLVINRFSRSGIRLDVNDGNTVAGNYIGTDVSGTTDLSNGADGILIYWKSGSNTIGGATSADRNVISGNGSNGIYAQWSADNDIRGNFIGLDATGSNTLGNRQSGIAIMNATGNRIGSDQADHGNVISGNQRYGIWLDGPTATVIQGNRIGTDASGTLDLGNLESGIFGGGQGHLIGGTTAAAGNLISGNNRNGIYFQGRHSVLQGNRIGTDATGTLPLGNSWAGIRFDGAVTNVLVGGTTPTAANLVAHNGFQGLVVVSTQPKSVAMLGNRVHSNGQLGIDLGQDGVTANDTGDADTGPNNLQNFPVLTTAVTSGGDLTVEGSLNSLPATPFRLEFFASSSADGSGYGEGQRYLGFANVTSDGSGNAPFNTTLTAAVTAGEYVSATATKCDSSFSTFTDTSEFSRNVVVVPASADVAATVSGPASVLATTNFSYTLTVANLGVLTATNVVVTDTLPAGVHVVSVSGGGTVVGGGPGQVVFDSASSNAVSGNLSWTHVTGNAANRLLLVGVSYGDSGLTNSSPVTAITYGGANLTRVLDRINSYFIPSARHRVSELWQLVNPPSGSNPILLTHAGSSTNFIAGAATFSGVDPATPLSAVASGLASLLPTTTASVVISSATHEIVFDNVAYDNTGPASPGPGQTQLWDLGAVQGGGASIKPGTNSATMSWSVPVSYWAHVAASIKPAGLIGVVNWTIPSLAGGSTTNFTVTVTAPLGGTLTNAVASTADTADSNAANNDGSAASARVITTVIPVADLVTTQSGPTTVAPLTTYNYTVRVSNLGPSTASNVVVTDTLAPTLTFVSASDGGTYLAGQVTWPALTSLPKGATADFAVTVRAPLSGTLTNMAAVTAAGSDPNPANSDGSAPAARVVTTVSPLQIENTSRGASVRTLNWSHTIAPGSSRILIVGVSIDDTNATVNAATFNNILPLTLIGQTNGPQTKVLMYRLLNPPVGRFSVSVNLNTAVGIVGGAVSLNGVNQTNPIAGFAGNSGTGSEASVTLASALGGVVIDTVAPKSPQYATNPSPAQTLEWNLSADDHSGAGSSSYGAASVTPSYALEGAATWAMGAVALNPATVLADLTLTATGPASVVATSNLTYSITLTNFGSATASNVVVSDVLPTGVTFVSASGGGTHDAGVVTWPVLTRFDNGATTHYTVTVTAPSVGTLTNIVYSTAFTADPDPSNNNGTGTNHQVLTTVATRSDVATTVTGPASVLANAEFSYSLTVTNAGPSPAENVVVNNTLPAGVTLVSASGEGTHSAGVVTWSLTSLDSGAATNLTVTVRAPLSGSLTNTVSSTSGSEDPEPSNNDGSAPAANVLTTVTPVADVEATVTGPGSVLAGERFSYTVRVANLGPSVATSVIVTDRLPASAVFVSASDGGTHDAGVVTWSLASLDSGAATHLTVTVQAPADGLLLNTVSSTSGIEDPDGSNNDGSAPAANVLTTVTSVADVVTTVTGPGSVVTNAPFRYTIAVANLGPTVATGLTVSDALPAGVTFLSASGGGTHNAGVVTWSLASLDSGAATNLTLTVLAPALGSLTNTVASTAIAGDPDPSNNDGSAEAARVVTRVYPFLVLTGQSLPGGFQVEFHTYPDTIYSIQASTNLVDWDTVVTTNSGEGHVIYLDHDATSHPLRFYRSRQ